MVRMPPGTPAWPYKKLMLGTIVINNLQAPKHLIDKAIKAQIEEPFSDTDSSSMEFESPEPTAKNPRHRSPDQTVSESGSD